MKFPTWTNGNGSFEAPRIVLEDDLNVGPSDGNNGKYRRPAARYDSREWDAGWTDGRAALRTDAHEQFLVSQAEYERHQEIRKARSERATARAAAQAFNNRLSLIEAELEPLRTYYKQLLERRHRYSSEASVPLGAMYLFFGTFLFLADVPLSVLVAEGLRIPTRARIPGTTRTVLLSQIFTDTWLVLEYLWEGVLLALGIALLGIIVKFFVDAVIFRDEDEPPLTIKATAGISAAFALFLICTWFLGALRADVSAGQPGVRPVSSEGWAFLLLTLTLPIAGGFCFSAGMRKLERAKSYYFTSARIWRLERRQRRAFEKYSQLSEQVSLLDATLGAEGDGLAVSRASLKKNLYRYGYARGRSVPETRDANETLYAFCKKTLDRMVASKAVRRLQDISE